MGTNTQVRAPDGRELVEIAARLRAYVESAGIPNSADQRGWIIGTVEGWADNEFAKEARAAIKDEEAAQVELSEAIRGYAGMENAFECGLSQDYSAAERSTVAACETVRQCVCEGCRPVLDGTFESALKGLRAGYKVRRKGKQTVLPPWLVCWDQCSTYIFTEEDRDATDWEYAE